MNALRETPSRQKIIQIDSTKTTLLRVTTSQDECWSETKRGRNWINYTRVLSVRHWKRKIEKKMEKRGKEVEVNWKTKKSDG